MSFDGYTPDKHGFTMDEAIVGDLITHTGNGKQYVIFGFVWLGETDEWGYLHRAIGRLEPLLARPLRHLCGKREDGSFRYEEHEEYERYYIV